VGEPRGELPDIGFTRSIGDLEAEVLDVLWRLDRGTVREVFEALRARGRRVQYTTVMTVMSRLVDRGILGRETSGVAYVYQPLRSREAVAESIIDEVVDRLLEGGVDTVIAHLIRRRPRRREDVEELRELLHAVEEAAAGESAGDADRS
jgi:predicted transcriptional regulator